MKFVVLFLLFFFTQLFGAHDSAYSNHGCYPAYAYGQLSQKTEQVDNVVASDNNPIPKISFLNKETDNLLFDEDENEDDELTRKYIQLSKSFPKFSNTILPNDICGCFSGQLSFHKYLSNIGSSKYIAQRVLRI